MKKSLIPIALFCALALVIGSTMMVSAKEKEKKEPVETKIVFNVPQSIEEVEKFSKDKNLIVTAVVIRGDAIAGGLLDDQGIDFKEIKKRWLSVVDQALNDPDTTELTKEKFNKSKNKWEKGDIKIVSIETNHQITDGLDKDPKVQSIKRK